MEEIPRERIDAPQIVKGTQPRLLPRIALTRGALDAELLRLAQDCLKRGDMLDEREKFERIAARMAAEALKEALSRHDRK